MELAHLNTLPHWLVQKGKWIVIPVALLYVCAWWLLGWSYAWDILVGRATPRNAPYPWCSWPLSVAGWMVVPAFIGAISGYMVTAQAGKRRDKTINDIADQVAQRLKPGSHS